VVRESSISISAAARTSSSAESGAGAASRPPGAQEESPRSEPIPQAISHRLALKTLRI
jgi:hypothetical protein